MPTTSNPIMKKALFTLAAATLSCTASQATETYTSSTTHLPLSYGGPTYGFNTTIDVPSGKSYIRVSDELPATAFIQSVSIKTDDIWGNTTPFKIAIYSYDGSHTLGSFLGLSESANLLPSYSTVTWDFNDIEVETSSSNTYMFLFVQESFTPALGAGSAGLTIGNFINQGYSVSPMLDVIWGSQGGGLQAGTGMYMEDGGLGFYSAFISSYSITLTDRAVNIPEPATATLGLLGLAALASRRRRGA